MQSGTSVLISGFIIGNNIGATKLIVRPMGPSLAQAGITNPLPDPTLELRDSNGALIMGNDNWQDDASQAAQISANGLAPGKHAGVGRRDQPRAGDLHSNRVWKKRGYRHRAR